MDFHDMLHLCHNKIDMGRLGLFLIGYRKSKLNESIDYTFILVNFIFVSFIKL